MPDSPNPQLSVIDLHHRIKDLEDQLATCHRLLHQQTHLIHLLEKTSDYVAIADAQGHFLYMNAAGRAMVGIDPDQDVTQLSIPDIIAPQMLQGELSRSLEVTLRDGIYQGETLLQHQKTHAEIPGSLVLICNRSGNGDPETFSAIVRDISAQKQAEAMMREHLHQAAVIQHQAEALRELSTPLIPLSRNAVIMPLIGAIDTQRAGHIMETLLHGIAQHKARIAIMDITGVPIVDTQVAQVLIHAAQAAKLLGTRVLLTGMSPALAQTIVALGIQLHDLTTIGSLHDGVVLALRADDQFGL